MYERSLEHSIERDDSSKSTLAIATFVLTALVVSAFAFAPARDPSKVIAGVPCSVVSEKQIGAVLHAPMRMLPETGNVCRYVATSGAEQTLTVIARKETLPPEDWGVPTSALDVQRHGDTLYVRSGDRSYLLFLVAPGEDPQTILADELRLAALARKPVVAQN